MYESPQVERYVDDQFFAFTRDKVEQFIELICDVNFCTY